MEKFFVLTRLSVLKIEIDLALTHPVALYSLGSRKNKITGGRACLRYRGKQIVIGPAEVKVATSTRVHPEIRWFNIDEVVALCLDRREVNDYMQKVGDSCTARSAFDPTSSTRRVLEAIGCDHPVIQVQS